MLYSKFFYAAAFANLAGMVAGEIERPWARHAHVDASFFQKRANGTGGDKVLKAGNIQTGSQITGEGLKDSEAGEAASDTDNANFVNFCQGESLTNGLQKKGGSCNGIVMGKIPSQDKMTSSIVTFPKSGQDLQANKDFNVQLQVANLQAGSFTNPDKTYYSAPQDLASDGTIIGHTHVTIQDLGGSLNPSTPPDAKKTAFFLGIDNAGDGNGGLQAKVAGGLAPGSYRVCTMASSSNHQPVLMPIAQRGAQDDCTKFTVGQGGGNGTAKRSVEDAWAATRRANLYDRTKRFAAREWIA